MPKAKWIVGGGGGGKADAIRVSLPTKDELLDEQRRLWQESQADHASTEGFLTVRLMMEHTGHSEEWIHDRLRQLKLEHRLATKNVHETNLADTLSWKTAYRISPRKGRDKQVVAGVGPLGGLDALRDRNSQGGRPPARKGTRADRRRKKIQN